MDWGAVVIGLGSLVVAGLSVYLSYKSRTSPYREKIYSKQVEGFAEVIDALTAFYIAAETFIVQQGCRLDDRSRPELRAKTLQLNQDFHRKHQRWAIFFPKRVNDSLSTFIKLFNGISVPPEVVYQYPANQVNTNDPGGLLADAYTKVIEAARECLGTEPLSEETLKMIGRVPNS